MELRLKHAACKTRCLVRDGPPENQSRMFGNRWTSWMKAWGLEEWLTHAQRFFTWTCASRHGSVRVLGYLVSAAHAATCPSKLHARMLHWRLS